MAPAILRVAFGRNADDPFRLCRIADLTDALNGFAFALVPAA
jgi:hypothetical protein